MHIAQVGHAGIGRVNRHTSKTAALRYMNVVDRAAHWRVSQRIPRTQPLEQQAAAMRQCNGPRIVGGLGTRLQHGHAQCAAARATQGGGQRGAHRAATDNRDVGLRRHDYGRVAINASISRTVLGAAAVRISQPLSVTTTSSSMRTPILANAAGTPSPGRM